MQGKKLYLYTFRLCRLQCYQRKVHNRNTDGIVHFPYTKTRHSETLKDNQEKYLKQTKVTSDNILKVEI